MLLRTAITQILVVHAVAFLSGCERRQEETFLVFPGANSRETYFSVHNIRQAQELVRGKGARIGILDHSFGFDSHRDLYAGGRAFQGDVWARNFGPESHHGYWMALVAREVAPDAELYALGTTSEDEVHKVAAMVQAIDWAIANRLDAVTYSDRSITASLRAPLDEAVGRAVAAGVVVTFIHYPHPDNLLPGGMFPRSGDDEREPDLNVFHRDYGVVFVNRYVEFMKGKANGYQPFLSISSTSPVTAGVVALMRSANPALSPAQCKQLLKATAKARVFEGKQVERVLDAEAAVRAALHLATDAGCSH